MESAHHIAGQAGGIFGVIGEVAEGIFLRVPGVEAGARAEPEAAVSILGHGLYSPIGPDKGSFAALAIEVQQARLLGGDPESPG